MIKEWWRQRKRKERFSELIKKTGLDIDYLIDTGLEDIERYVAMIGKGYYREYRNENEKSRVLSALPVHTKYLEKKE